MPCYSLFTSIPLLLILFIAHWALCCISSKSIDSTNQLKIFWCSLIRFCLLDGHSPICRIMVSHCSLVFSQWNRIWSFFFCILCHNYTSHLPSVPVLMRLLLMVHCIVPVLVQLLVVVHSIVTVLVRSLLMVHSIIPVLVRLFLVVHYRASACPVASFGTLCRISDCQLASGGTLSYQCLSGCFLWNTLSYQCLSGCFLW